MAQVYSDPSRESDKWSLPDVEVFYLSESDLDGIRADNEGPHDEEDDEDTREPGWYYWYCFPGCMPEGDMTGPYATEDDAIAAMREAAE